jgi:hypothetical protein
MKLTTEETVLFYKLFYPLLLFVNKKKQLVKGSAINENIKNFTIEEIQLLRDELYSSPDIIDQFVMENASTFPEEDLDIVYSWKKFIKKSFYIVSYQKKYTIFLDLIEPAKAYGVLALGTPFIELAGKALPVMAETVLLPFKDKIIYDHILIPYNTIKLNADLKKIVRGALYDAKSNYGIITDLNQALQPKEQIPEEILKFYLQSARSREVYKHQINRMIDNNNELLNVYHHELGKSTARIYRKKFTDIGIHGAWFGIYEQNIVGSGKTKEEAEHNIRNILPEEKLKFVYYFDVK